MVKLLIVEDHALVREGLVRVLSQIAPAVDVLEAADAEAMYRLVDQEEKIDLVVLDLGLPGVDGFACLKRFRLRYPSIPVVILSAYDDPHTVDAAMRSGADGFVSKSATAENLQKVLAGVLQRGRDVTAGKKTHGALKSVPLHAEQMLSLPDFGLTARQAEVLRLMVSGKTNRAIAALLGLSEGTVKVHLTAIFKALGVSSRTQAMALVARHGIRYQANRQTT